MREGADRKYGEGSGARGLVEIGAPWLHTSEDSTAAGVMWIEAEFLVLLDGAVRLWMLGRLAYIQLSSQPKILTQRGEGGVDCIDLHIDILDKNQ